jgi:hypothetical protein
MSEIIGTYLSEVDYTTCCVTALHDGSSVALWDHGARVASYLADWIGAHLAQALDSASSATRADAVRHTVCFTLHELIENALKYRCGGELIISVGLTASAVVISISNEIVNLELNTLRTLLQKISAKDPGEGLRLQVEANANPQNGPRTSAGIGYLTLLYDYKISLGWQLTASAVDTTRMTTMAHLPLRTIQEVQDGN